MDNFTNRNTARRYTAHLSIFGTTQVHLRNPAIIAWWSAAFPGFGHILLSKYLRGFALFIWEVVVNTQAHINMAIIYSFQGKIDMAIDVLDTRWLLVYLPVYFFGIWDSYRSTVDLNKVYVLSEREEHPFNTFSIGAWEINYLDKRSPVMAGVWSLIVPGLGQLYLHRVLTAFFIIFWTILFYYLSHVLEAATLLIVGDVQQATFVLREEWFLMLPSIYGFAVFDAYSNTVEINKLFKKVQSRFLKENYQDSKFHRIKGQIGK